MAAAAPGAASQPAWPASLRSNLLLCFFRAVRLTDTSGGMHSLLGTRWAVLLTAAAISQMLPPQAVTAQAELKALQLAGTGGSLLGELGREANRTSAPPAVNLALHMPVFFPNSKHARSGQRPSDSAYVEGTHHRLRPKDLTRTSAVTDGNTEAFFEDPDSHVTVQMPVAGSPGPWLVVDLRRQHEILAVEVWLPMQKCDRYLRKLSSQEKKAAQAMLDLDMLPPLACRSPASVHSPRRLQAELFSEEDPLMTSQAAARLLETKQAAVYFFHMESEGRFVRVSAPGSDILRVAEVKVWGYVGSTNARWCESHCEGSGGCSDAGLCSCAGEDRLGPDCTTNPFTSSAFLPLTTEGSGWWDGRVYRAFQDNIARQQNQRCEAAAAFPVLPGPGGAGAGLGSSLYFLAGQMTKAYDSGVPLLHTGFLNYAMNPWCEKHGAWGLLSCYFMPLTEECIGPEQAMRESFPHASPVDSLVERSGPMASAGGSKQKRKGGRSKRGGGSLADASRQKRSDCMLLDRTGRLGAGCDDMGNMTARSKAHPRLGLLMLRSLQVAHLMRPNAKLLSELDLEATIQRIGYLHPIIGLHMRGGDGCRYGVRARQFRCRSLEDYLPELRSMSMKYGVNRVFLASDEPAAIEQAQRLGEFEWVFLPHDRSLLASRVKIEHRLQDESPGGLGGRGKHSMLVAALRELYLLGRADFFVGHLASSFSRLALNLNIVNHRRVPPYISMDGPWCPHWRMCCDVNTATGTSTVC